MMDPLEGDVPAQPVTDELLLAMLVEKRAYVAYIKDRTARNRRVWIAATTDLRFKGGSPIVVRRVRNQVMKDESTVLSPDSPLDMKARSVLRSLVESDRARRPAAIATQGVAEGRPSMAGIKIGDVSTLELDIPEGTCGDGCGEPVKGKSKYRQGHDARLRSMLYQAHRKDVPVAVIENGSRREGSALTFIQEHGFPTPAEKPAPKAKATTAKATTRKAPARVAPRKTRRARAKTS